MLVCMFRLTRRADAATETASTVLSVRLAMSASAAAMDCI